METAEKLHAKIFISCKYVVNDTEKSGGLKEGIEAIRHTAVISAPRDNQ